MSVSIEPCFAVTPGTVETACTTTPTIIEHVCNHWWQTAAESGKDPRAPSCRAAGRERAT